MSSSLDLFDIQTLIQKIVSDVSISLHNNLQPLIERINEDRHNYQLISNIMRQMPDFQNLIKENTELKKEIKEYNKTSSNNKMFAGFPFATINNGDSVMYIPTTFEPIKEVCSESSTMPTIMPTTTQSPIMNVPSINEEPKNIIILEVKEEIHSNENIDDKLNQIYLDVELTQLTSSKQIENESEIEIESEDEYETDEEDKEEVSEAEEEEEEAEAEEAEAEEEEASEAEEEAASEAEEEAASESAEEEEAVEEEASESAEEEAATEAQASEAATEAQASEAATEAQASEAATEEQASEEEEEEAQEEASEAASEEAVTEEQAEASEAASEEEQEEEVFIVTIEDYGDFYTNDDVNGNIYEITESEDVGDQVGVFKNKKAIMNE
jgi:hypothetical protein